MDQSGRTRLITLLVSAVLVALGVAFFALHMSSPSDGARLQLGQAGWRQNGVAVSVLRPTVDGLRSGDVVIAVDGRSMESWAERLFHPAATPTRLNAGSTIEYTVLRDGRRSEVRVQLGAYPLGAILAESWGTILFAVAFELIALYVFIRRPAERVAQVLLIGASSLVSSSTWSFGLQVSDLTRSWGFWLYTATTLAAYGLFWISLAHFALTFPRQHPIVARWPRLIPSLYVAPVAAYTIYFVFTRMGTTSTLDWVGLWMPTEGVLAVVYIVLMIGVTISQYRLSRDAALRQQIRWVVFASLISAGGGLIVWVVPQDVLGYQLISVNMLGLLGLPVPVAIAIAVLRYRLFDIDVIIRRTLIYGTLTTVLAGIYFAVVVSAQLLGQHFTGQTQLPAWLIVVTTLAIAGLFTPLRHRVQQTIDQRFYRGRYDAARTLAAFAAVLRSEVDIEVLTQDLIGVVVETMQPAQVTLWLSGAGTSARIGEHPLDGSLPAARD